MKRHSSRQSPAFSLIEVSAAVAIVSVALISLLALIPMGLENARACRNETRAVTIAKSVASTLTAEPFKKAQCFSADMVPLDLSLVDESDEKNEAPIYLYASFDARRDFPVIIRSDSLPADMSKDLEVLRIELRFAPRSTASSTIYGSSVQVRIFPQNIPLWTRDPTKEQKRIRDQGAIFVGSTVLSCNNKEGLLQQTEL